MTHRKQSVPDINNELVLAESLQEFLEDNAIVEDYKKLKEKCEVVITKIRKRKIK